MARPGDHGLTGACGRTYQGRVTECIYNTDCAKLSWVGRASVQARAGGRVQLRGVRDDRGKNCTPLD